MDLGIANKVAVVAASSRGLGKAVALSLAREGVRVVICSRNSDALKAAEADIRAAVSEAEVYAVTADLTNASDIERLVEMTVDRHDTVHILVNNAGGPPAGYFEDLTDESWQQGFDLTLMSSVRLTKAVLPYMQKQKWGRIVNITSISVRQPIEELLLSSSLRLSIVGWAKTLSNQVASQGILVNNVCPGWTRTDRVVEIINARAAAQKADREKIEAGITAGIPMQRLGKPEELASLVTFLASEQASYITGTSIQVDGGAVRGY